MGSQRVGHYWALTLLLRQETTQIRNERSKLWEKYIDKEAYSLICLIQRLSNAELQRGKVSGRWWDARLHFQAFGYKMSFHSRCCHSPPPPSVFSARLSLPLKHQRIQVMTILLPLSKCPSLALCSDQIKVNIVHLQSGRCSDQINFCCFHKKE